LIFTDPVYDRIDDYRWLAWTSSRILKLKRALLTFFGIGYMEETYRALREGGMPVSWLFPVLQIGQTQRVHQKVFNHWYGLLWCGGEPISTIADVINSPTSTLDGNHVWRKNLSPVKKRIAEFTNPGDVVVDFFTGGGTIPAACKILGRRYVAFESDPETAETARQRVAETQPPLFVTHAEQPVLI
jgi:hypothetical protein